MPIIVVCHKCGTLATVPDSAAGMQGKCERCKNVIYVPGGAVKRCCACQVDVTHTERTKDAAGNYYCAQCTKTKQHAMEAEAAKASATAEPGAASESAICVLCRAEVPKTILCNFDGDLVCNACAQHAGLGTASYRKKKTRWGGRSIIYRCAQCQGDLESALDETGKEDYCPQCGTAFEVPGRYENFRAARPTTALKPNGAVPVAAPALGDSTPPPHTTATGMGKWLVVGAGVMVAVLAVVMVAGYLAMKSGTAPPQTEPATATAGRPNAITTQPVTKVAGGKAGAAGVASAAKAAAAGAVARAAATAVQAEAAAARSLASARAQSIADNAAHAKDLAVAAAKVNMRIILANLDNNLQGETSAWRGLDDDIHAATEMVAVWARLSANLNGAHAATPIRAARRNLNAELAGENSAIRAIEENDQAFFQLLGVLLRYQGRGGSRVLPQYARIRQSLNSEVAVETSAFRVEQEATHANMLALGCLAVARGNAESARKIIKQTGADNAADDSAIRAATRNARGELEILLQLVRDKDPAKATAIANRVDAATQGEDSSIREHEDYEQGIIAAIKFEIGNP